MKDWTGNKKTTFVTLGASNHSDKERESNDYYATDPKSLEIFLNKIQMDNIHLCNQIWECACGEGHLSKVLENRGYKVYSTDLIDRGFGEGNIDFLKYDGKKIHCDILTNPPYKYAKEFVEKPLDIQDIGYKTIMFLKIQFLEGQARKKLFETYPPKFVYVNSVRQACYFNGDMSKKMNSASCYCWYIWEKGFKGETIIRWL